LQLKQDVVGKKLRLSKIENIEYPKYMMIGGSKTNVNVTFTKSHNKDQIQEGLFYFLSDHT